MSFTFKFTNSAHKHTYNKMRTEMSANTGAATSHHRSAHSDQEVLLLATSYPKKRAGRRVFKETRHPIFRGVRKRNNEKWVCELREPNKKSRIWLGTYPTPEMAARAHDVAALALRGKSACLNFADSASRLPVPVSKEPKDIRRAAHEAAELFRPRVGVEDGGGSGVDKQENDVSFVDEEGDLLTNMAEGPLLSPPHYLGVGDGMNWDELLVDDADLPLWSFSI